MVLQEAKGIEDQTVSVGMFPGTITRFLGGQLSVTGLHGLKPYFQVWSGEI